MTQEEKDDLIRVRDALIESNNNGDLSDEDLAILLVRIFGEYVD